MECPNCSFQNMPGLKRCARCAGMLEFAGVDYVPPRASGGAAVRAARGAASRFSIGANRRIADSGRWMRSLLSMNVDWPAVWWSAIPGLGHLREGHRRLGWLLIATWLALVALTLLYAGGAAGWFWCFVLVGFHCFVITLLLSRSLQYLSIPFRLLAGIAVYAALTLVIYLPARWALGNVVTPVQMNGLRANDVLSNNDVILCAGEWLRPNQWQRGDVVLYRIPQHGMGNVILASGYGLDRIVAVAGDKVEIREGRLLVNGVEAPADMLPLDGVTRLDAGFVMHVSQGECLIIPSVLSITVNGAYEAQLRDLHRTVSRVPVDAIVGKAWWRLRPWSGFGAISAQ